MSISQPRRRGPLITMADYERIHSVTRAVLDGLGAHPAGACVFFSLAGALLLARHHKLDATPVAGAALYGVGGKQALNVFTFAQIVGDELQSDADAFHCWVDCEGWVIDFMTPVFPEHARQQGIHWPIPRKMFQRPRESMAASWRDLVSDGDYFLSPSAELTATLLDKHLKKASVRDLLDICDHWYRRTPKRMQTTQAMASSDGSVTTLRAKSAELTGAW